MNKPNLLRTSVFVATIGLLPATASAHSLDAHVHGEANMAIVIDGKDVSISLMSPMFNITGFEHAPETDEQRGALETAMSLLDDSAQLFEINASAECTPVSAHHSLSAEEEQSDPAENSEDDAEGEEAHHHNHRDLEAEYAYSCQSPSKLSSIKLVMFDQFQNLQKVKVVILAGNNQSAAELTPEQEMLSLAGS